MPKSYSYRFRTKLRAVKVEPNRGFYQYPAFEREIEFLFESPDLTVADIPGTLHAREIVEEWLTTHLRDRDLGEVMRTEPESGVSLADYLLLVFAQQIPTLVAVTVFDGDKSWTVAEVAD